MTNIPNTYVPDNANHHIHTTLVAHLYPRATSASQSCAAVEGSMMVLSLLLDASAMHRADPPLRQASARSPNRKRVR